MLSDFGLTILSWLGAELAVIEMETAAATTTITLTLTLSTNTTMTTTNRQAWVDRLKRGMLYSRRHTQCCFALPLSPGPTPTTFSLPRLPPTPLQPFLPCFFVFFRSQLYRPIPRLPRSRGSALQAQEGEVGGRRPAQARTDGDPGGWVPEEHHRLRRRGSAGARRLCYLLLLFFFSWLVWIGWVHQACVWGRVFAGHDVRRRCLVGRLQSVLLAV